MSQIKGLNIANQAPSWSFYDGAVDGTKDGILSEAEIQVQIQHWEGKAGQVPEQTRQDALTHLNGLLSQIKTESTTTGETFGNFQPSQVDPVGNHIPSTATPSSGNSVLRTLLGMMKEEAVSTNQVNTSTTSSQSPTIQTEKALPIAQLTHLGHGVDGFQMAQHSGNLKDGFVTESELTGLIEAWSQSNIEDDVKTAQLKTYQQALNQIQLEGQEIELPSQQTNEPIDIDQLATFLDTKISSFKRKKADTLIEKANVEFVHHKEIEDPLELAVFGYTTSHYRELNKALRSGDPDTLQASETYIQGVQEGLAKLPGYDNQTVWRGARLSADIISKYEPGQVVREAAFTSTSHDSKKKFSGNVTFVIQTREEDSQGKLVSHLSDYPNEKEVLFNRDTEFFVLKKEDDPNKTNGTIIYMQEL